jgi:hypothetical protein
VSTPEEDATSPFVTDLPFVERHDYLAIEDALNGRDQALAGGRDVSAEEPGRRYVVREVREAVIEAASPGEAISTAYAQGPWRIMDLYCAPDTVKRHMDSEEET